MRLLESKTVNWDIYDLVVTLGMKASFQYRKSIVNGCAALLQKLRRLLTAGEQYTVHTQIMLLYFICHTPSVQMF